MSRDIIKLFLGNQLVFTSISYDEDGTIFDMISNGVTECRLEFGPYSFNSTDNPTYFDYTTNGANGEISYDLTDAAGQLKVGQYSAKMGLVYPAAPNGRVHMEGIPILISDGV